MNALRPPLVLALSLIVLALAAPGAVLAAGDCCAFALELTSALTDLATRTDLSLASTGVLPGDVPGSRSSALLKALDKAEEAMTSGMADGGTCDAARARLRFQNARGWIASYRQILADVHAQDSPLDGAAFFLAARVESLIAGVCEDGPALPLR
jgi:hypothetical protein